MMRKSRHGRGNGGGGGLTLEALECRRMMAVGVHIKNETFSQIVNGQTVSVGSGPGFDYGFVRLHGAGPTRQVTYGLRNSTGAPLTVTDIKVPAGFRIVSAPADGTVLPATGPEAELTVELNKNAAGAHKGYVQIDSGDGETFRFQIMGTVADYAATGAYNLGALGNASRGGTITYQKVTDFAGSSVFNPGVNVYRFSLAAKSDVNLNLFKDATGLDGGVTMRVYRDANGDGALQVGEETGAFPQAHVAAFAEQGSLTDSRHGTLAAGAYLIKCTSFDGATPEGLSTIDYHFTVSATATGNPQIGVRVGTKPAIVDGDLNAAVADGTDFGAAAVGAIVRREFVVKNTGAAPLQLSPAAFLSGNSGFSIDGGLPSSIAVGGTAKLTLRMVTDASGHKAAQVVIPTNDPAVGQFNFAVAGDVTVAGGKADGGAPTAGLASAKRVRTPGGGTYRFTVRYADADGIDETTIDRGDVRVSGPKDFFAAARVVSKAVSDGGKTVDVRYRLTPPGGAWNRGDNGSYAVRLRGGEVADAAGHAAGKKNLGAFVVKIPKGATPAVATIAPMAPTPFSMTTIARHDDAVWDLA